MPPSFNLTPAMLELAFAGVLGPAGCRRGDTIGVAELGVECFKLLHKNPEERNIYLNPSRADQGLMYVHPPRWEKVQLEAP